MESGGRKGHRMRLRSEEIWEKTHECICNLKERIGRHRATGE